MLPKSTQAKIYDFLRDLTCPAPGDDRLVRGIQEQEIMRQQIRRAMQDPDGVVLTFDYTDQKGNQTRRVVSPVRFANRERFLALCLSREAPRFFQLNRMSNVQVAAAHHFVMPVPLA